MIHTDLIDKNTCIFQFDKQIAKGEFSIANSQSAAFSPVARKLFGFPWVEKLVVGTESIHLTKKEWVDWDIIIEPLTGLLEEHFSAATDLEAPLPTANAKANITGDSKTDDHGPEYGSVKQFIEDEINPSLAAHGGFIELKTFENNVAYLSMGGGCQGCASSQATMFDGVESALKSQFSFVHRVIDMTDHASGENPFYS